MTIVSTDLSSCYPDEECPSDDTVRFMVEYGFCSILGAALSRPLVSYFLMLSYVCSALFFLRF